MHKNTYNFVFRSSFRLYLVSTSLIAPFKMNNIVRRTHKQETQNTKVKSQLKHRNKNDLTQNTMSHIGFRTCKYEMNPIKNVRENVVPLFSHNNPICCHENQRSDPAEFQTHSSSYAYPQSPANIKRVKSKIAKKM